MAYSDNLIVNNDAPVDLTGWTQLGVTVVNDATFGENVFRLAGGASMTQTIDISSLSGNAKVFIALDSLAESVALQSLSWAKAEILVQGTNKTIRAYIPISTRRSVIMIHEIEEELDAGDTFIAASFTITADVAPILVTHIKLMVTPNADDTPPVVDPNNLPDQTSSPVTKLLRASLIDIRSNGMQVHLEDNTITGYTFTMTGADLTKITDDAQFPTELAWNTDLPLE